MSSEIAVDLSRTPPIRDLQIVIEGLGIIVDGGIAHRCMLDQVAVVLCVLTGELVFDYGDGSFARRISVLEFNEQNKLLKVRVQK